jgi:hypothetical protein
MLCATAVEERVVMARILLQTTIPQSDDNWHVGRFSMVADELRVAGHAVTARDRNRGFRPDPVLSRLDNLEFDELWLMAVDQGDGLAKEDTKGILRFRARGGGVLTARDHADLGCCLCTLGTLGRMNHFSRFRSEGAPIYDDRDNPDIAAPNVNSGANGDYQPVFVHGPVHEILRTTSGGGDRIEWFPAHPHEGAVYAPLECDFARVLAQGRSSRTGRRFNLAAIVDGEVSASGRPMGRAVVTSTFHQFADYNWDTQRGAPSFVTDPPGSEIERDPSRLAVYMDYVTNLARWLAP